MPRDIMNYFAKFALLFFMSMCWSASACAASVDPSWASELDKEARALLQASVDVERDAWRNLPILNSSDLKIASDGSEDVTPALQRALDDLREGGTLVLAKGVYKQQACLVIRNNRVRIIGRGAVLHASNPDDMCIKIEGKNVELRNLTLTADVVARGNATRQARIVIHGSHAVIEGNVLNGATSAGIWIQGAHDFVVARNHISHTLADGIHHSEGAWRGYVGGNRLEETGDDGIAVVSYLNSARSGHVLIEDNRVANVPWARGIAIIGSTEVIVRRNIVDGTGRAAGIIVSREASYNTYGVSRTIVDNNIVRNVQERFSLLDWHRTGQAAIDINATEGVREDLWVRDVMISNNIVERSRLDGIRVFGSVCDISILGNTIRAVGKAAITAAGRTCPEPISVCDGNVVETNKVPIKCH